MCGVTLAGAGSRDGVSGSAGGKGSVDVVACISGSPCSNTTVSCAFERLLYLIKRKLRFEFMIFSVYFGYYKFVHTIS